MLIVPSAMAWMLTERLLSMVLSSVVIAMLSGVLGHLMAIGLPHAMGFKSANSAAMVAVASGVLLILAIFMGPKRGLVWRWMHQRRLFRRIFAEDVLALFYRHVEAKRLEGSDGLIEHALSAQSVASKMQQSTKRVLAALSELASSNWVVGSGNTWHLTQDGYRQAQLLVRTHRLWEHFLREETGISDPRLHASAESLEHFTSAQLRESLDQVTGGPTIDPHGRHIPPEKDG
jgi:Mn-dependent DtxR family transcriptional regulator